MGRLVAPHEGFAAVLYCARDVRLEPRPVPVPGKGEVSVEMRAVGVCGSDVHYYDLGRNGPNILRRPCVLGHETAGVVLAVGEGVDHGRIGERVSVEPASSCGQCRYCKAGRYNLCSESSCMGSPPTDGAMRTVFTAEAANAHPLPAGIDDIAGAVVEPLAVVVHAFRRAGLSVGARVLVTGAGPVGILAVQVALASGAAEVAVTDVNSFRLDSAAHFGAQPLSSEGTASGNRDFDAVFECSGSPKALSFGIDAVARGGTVVLIGTPQQNETPTALATLQRREVNVITCFRCANDFPAAIALLANGKVRTEGLVTGLFSLEEAEKALKAARDDHQQLKVVVRP